MARIHRLRRVVLGAAAAALLAGCSVMTPIQTAEPYAASDGFRITITPEVRAENVMVLTEEEGGEGQVFGALVNNSEREVTMSLSIAQGGIEVPVPARSQVLLGVEEPVIVPAVPAAPGAVIETQLSADGYGSVVEVAPVLDDTLPQYDEHVPS